MWAEGAADNSTNLTGNEEVVSLSDIVPETNICVVSLSEYFSTLLLKAVMGHNEVTDSSLYFTVIKSNKKCTGHADEDAALVDATRWLEVRST